MVGFIVEMVMVSRDVLLVGDLIDSLYGAVGVPGLVVDVCIPGDCLRLFEGITVHFVLGFVFLVCAVRSSRLIPGLVER